MGYVSAGAALPVGQSFTLDGIAYPANWLALASSEDLAARGITQEDDPAPPAPTKAELASCANMKHSTVLSGGVTINGVRVSTTAEGRVDMAGAVSLAQLVPDHVFDWVGATGAVQLTASQVIQIGTAVGLWVQSTYTVLGSVLADIESGTITTTAQIDAANWPAN
jgi:hypothetical protein